MCRLAQYNKVTRSFTRTQKRRALRENTTTSRRKELGKLDSKSKFGRSTTENQLSDEDDDLLREEDVKERKTVDLCMKKFHI